MNFTIDANVAFDSVDLIKERLRVTDTLNQSPEIFNLVKQAIDIIQDVLVNPANLKDKQELRTAEIYYAVFFEEKLLNDSSFANEFNLANNKVVFFTSQISKHYNHNVQPSGSFDQHLNNLLLQNMTITLAKKVDAYFDLDDQQPKYFYNDREYEMKSFEIVEKTKQSALYNALCAYIKTDDYIHVTGVLSNKEELETALLFMTFYLHEYLDACDERNTNDPTKVFSILENNQPILNDYFMENDVHEYDFDALLEDALEKEVEMHLAGWLENCVCWNDLR
jgi:hypothetical protein